MPLIPFSKKFSNEFLSRTEDNFDVFLEKLKIFYNTTRPATQDGRTSRRELDHRFNYKEELVEEVINQKGISTEEVALEFNDMFSGCIRHQDPIAAFNIIPSPLFDSVAGITLAAMYNTNICWDFISGKTCLYEKKIARMLGHLVDWPESDGLVVTGGKQAFTYAIKNGMRRANKNNLVRIDNNVVICSMLAHYSIEHVCHFLGISPENCLRIPTKLSGEIDLIAFKRTLGQVIKQGKKIAAVIATGGGTVNLVPDPISQMKRIIDLIVKQFHLDYTPYFHVDSVITWTWLAFKNEFDYLKNTQSHPNTLKKIKNVLVKLQGIHDADSFAADFHKTGFCPYASGVFIAKNSENLLGMMLEKNDSPKCAWFGELEPFHQTIENSRSALPVVSIWIAIQRMGLEGFREFILYQLEVCELFKKKIQKKCSEHFEILNNHSNGWEIVLKPHFHNKMAWDHLQESSNEEQESYVSDCSDLLYEYWYSHFDNKKNHPLIGFISKYSRKGIFEKSLPAFLIHPTSLHYDENAIDEMVSKILEIKVSFDLKHYNKNLSKTKQHFFTLTPPK